jgi:uncharacterized membrane protein
MMAVSKRTPRGKIRKKSGLFARLRGYFLAGLLVTSPAALTLYLAWMFISFVDTQVAAVLPPRYHPGTYLGFDVPGFGVLVLLVTMTVIGAATAGLIGRLLLRWGEGILNRMPVIRGIYGSLKQLFETVLSQKSSAFRQCVLVEYPRKGMWALGFISGVTEGEVQDLTKDEVLNVFVPTTPNPTSGFLLFVPRGEVVLLSMSVEEGIKMVISGGIVVPPDRRGKETKRAKPAALSPSAGSPPPRPAQTGTKGT